MRSWAERLLWTGALACSVAALGLVLYATNQRAVTPWRMPELREGGSAGRSDLGELVLQVSATDPFRLTRRPAELPFGMSNDAVAPARDRQVPPVLTGIIGPPWRAVLERVGRREESAVVAEGDTLAGLRILRVRSDSIVIQARDTTWRLGVRRLW